MTVLRVSISLSFTSLVGIWSTYLQHCWTILVTAAFNWLLLFVKLMIFSLSWSHFFVSKQSCTIASKIRPVEMASAPCRKRNEQWIDSAKTFKKKSTHSPSLLLKSIKNFQAFINFSLCRQSFTDGYLFIASRTVVHFHLDDTAPVGCVWFRHDFSFASSLSDS